MNRILEFKECKYCINKEKAKVCRACKDKKYFILGGMACTRGIAL